MYGYCINNPVIYMDINGNDILKSNIQNKAEKNRIYNNQYSYSGYIYGQSNFPIGNMKLGDKTLSYNGCEIVATYNAMLLLGADTTIQNVIYYYDKDYKWGNFIDMDGKIGVSYNKMENFLTQRGYKVTDYTYDGNYNSLPKGIYIYSFLHSAGIHSVAISKNDDGTILVYNAYSKDNAPRKYNSMEEYMFADSHYCGLQLLGVSK